MLNTDFGSVVECGGKPADIMFALDSSASIPFKDFQKEINFTQNLIKIFDIGSDKTRVGLVTFRYVFYFSSTIY